MADQQGSSEETKTMANRKPSLSLAVFVCWVVPILIIAAVSRFAVDTNQASVPIATQDSKKSPFPTPTPTSKPSSNKNKNPAKRGQLTPEKGPSGMPTVLANKPTAYVEIVEAIGRKRVDWGDVTSDPVGQYHGTSKPKAKSSDSPKVSKPDEANGGERQPRKQDEASSPEPRGASTDPVRQQYLREIAALRESFMVRVEC